ncbi:MAG TPA: cyclic nucleotide-binding domain-containing protein [Stellaceae bacterium]|nr:cyclic nucleotide-binding domain-containing protein [Stellaceae bacterium]
MLATVLAETPRPAAIAAYRAPPCESCAARKLSICSAMRSEDLGRLAASRTHQSIAAGETLLEEGEPATHFFNMIEGAVKVYKLMPDGRRQITGFLFAGDFLGLAFNDSYTYSAEAVTPVKLCRFPRRQLERLLDEFPRMERRLLVMASNELAVAQEQMMLLGRKTAHERIASFLLALARREERAGRDGDRLSLPMTRTDIADYLGLTTETASRVFTSLKKQGYIALEAGGVVIADRGALEELAAGME